MNKPLKLVLTFSIAINAIGLIGAAAGWFLIEKPKTPGNVAQAGDGNGDIGALSPEAAKEVAAFLSTSDAVALRDGLRALGLPDDLVRAVVSARIRSRFTARFQEINKAAQEEVLQRPYWRGKLRTGLDLYTSEQWKELSELGRETSKQTSRILGTDGEIPSNAQIKYAFLPSDKAGPLQSMLNDYLILRDQVGREMAGFRMPGDDAAIKLIDEEMKRELEAMLTPGEKAAYDLRHSDAAGTLQRVFAGFDGTEEEYKAVFALQNALEEKYPMNMRLAAAVYGGADPSSEAFRNYREGQNEVNAQIKELLGDARYADYVRGSRKDYQTLQAAAQRFNLSAETVAQTYQVREDTAGEAKRISDDKSLNAAQKTEAYAALAEQATGQIRATLGDEAGDAYIDNALVWLKNLPKGGTVRIDERGNVSVSQPRPAPQARGQGGGGG